MLEHVQLPPETLSLIFRYLSPLDLSQCLRVSRLWHAEAEPQLYRNMVLEPGMTLRRQVLAACTRKHLIRRVEFASSYGYTIPLSDILDFLLDYRPPLKHSDDAVRTSTWTSSVPFPIPAGPNRPTLTHFSHQGYHQSWRLFDAILHSLTSLVSLDLDFLHYDSTTRTNYVVDLDRILTRFPRLKHLGIIGTMVEYAPPRAARHEGQDESTTGHCCLESFTFNPALMWREGPDAFSLFRRLGDLRKLSIISNKRYGECARRTQPWAFGRALKQFCSKVESIQVEGAAVLWLFDLPILPYYEVPFLAELVSEALPSSPSDLTVGMVQAQRGAGDRLRQRLQEQEVSELLEGRTAVPFFPQLKTLILGTSHSLSMQDLISLGVQARFLTHVEIKHQAYGYEGVWDMYDTDAATAASASVPESTTHASLAANNNWQFEDRRLWKRRHIGNLDVILFLQLCSSLRYFSITRRTIPLLDLTAGDLTSPVNSETSATIPRKAMTPTIHRWACEETLQTLKLGLSVHPSRSKEYHAMVWNHFGRLQNLRSLSFPMSSLVPSPAYGLEGLLTGGGRLSETLTEVRSLPSWWEVEDLRGMVLWFAKSFPNLVVLGLMHYREQVEGGKVENFIGFLDDEDVKRCSIHRIFVEPRST
ncbi:hypothetical protein KI688_012490 [Linnemannia hyalina]|uniref:F-box domain-containing protein n=1 Tax=Linnemannia hyalina TaxID=64524 RepID=A0A9P8BV41_9FUNG|nr:hypothetical protein KI688_012490 [Linnemannia hyalina]